MISVTKLIRGINIYPGQKLGIRDLGQVSMSETTPGLRNRGEGLSPTGIFIGM